jgi:hypothetical protein
MVTDPPPDGARCTEVLQARPLVRHGPPGAPLPAGGGVSRTMLMLTAVDSRRRSCAARAAPDPAPGPPAENRRSGEGERPPPARR